MNESLYLKLGISKKNQEIDNTKMKKSGMDFASSQQLSQQRLELEKMKFQEKMLQRQQKEQQMIQKAQQTANQFSKYQIPQGLPTDQDAREVPFLDITNQYR